MSRNVVGQRRRAEWRVGRESSFRYENRYRLVSDERR